MIQLRGTNLIGSGIKLCKWAGPDLKLGPIVNGLAIFFLWNPSIEPWAFAILKDRNTPTLNPNPLLNSYSIGDLLGSFMDHLVFTALSTCCEAGLGEYKVHWGLWKGKTANRPNQLVQLSSWIFSLLNCQAEYLDWSNPWAWEAEVWA